MKFFLKVNKSKKFNSKHYKLHQNSIEITNINDLEKESSKLENKIMKALEKATKTNEFFSKPKFNTNIPFDILHQIKAKRKLIRIVSKNKLPFLKKLFNVPNTKIKKK